MLGLIPSTNSGVVTSASGSGVSIDMDGVSSTSSSLLQEITVISESAKSKKNLVFIVFGFNWF
jgi:anti-anti-sigma regulatory factor